MRKSFADRSRRMGPPVDRLHHEPCAGAFVFDSCSPTILVIEDTWGNFGVPKGQYDEKDKTALDCARREVEEETGIEFDLVQKGQLAYEEERIRYTYVPRGKVRKHVTLFIGRARVGSSIRIQTSEVRAAMFVTIKEFRRLVKNDSLVAAFDVAMVLLQASGGVVPRDRVRLHIDVGKKNSVGNLAGEEKDDGAVLLSERILDDQTAGVSRCE